MRKKGTGRRRSTIVGGEEEGEDTTMDGGMRAKEGEDTTMDGGTGAKEGEDATMDDCMGAKEDTAKEDTVEKNPRESDRKDAAQSSGGSVAEFDYSVENFFAGMDAIGDLCGMPRAENFDANEIERFSSMVTFLKEWKFFNYEPKVINFTYEQAKDLPKDVKLPQFSAASVPKMVELPEARKHCNSTDFILHAGGLVWALDWCPGNHVNQDSKIKCEYLAVAAHPPSSAYHKIGSPLIGRGVIQIWCLLNLDEDIEIPIIRTRARGRPRKKPVEQKPDADSVEVSTTPMPRGRPRNCPAKEKPTTSRPRGRCRKRPASSSDEESLTPTRSQGRHKKLMPSALDQNDLEDLSPQNLIGAPEKNLATISRGDNTSSSRKPRGRPRKHPLIIDVNEEDTPALDINGITSTPDMHSAKKGLVTTSIGDSASSSRKPRGRPRKHPLPVIIDVNEEDTPALDINGITSTPDMHSAKKGLVTTSIGYSASSSRKPRGRPRKHPLPIIINVNEEDTPALDINGITSTLDMHSAKKGLVTYSIGDSASSSRKPRGRPRKHPLPVIIDMNEEDTPALDINGITSTPDMHSAKKGLVITSISDSASSSRKPRGRPRKHPLPVIIDVNEEGTPALDINGITSTPDMHSAKKGIVTTSIGDSASSSRKPRGRPWKHPLPVIIDVNEEDTPTLDINGITSTPLLSNLCKDHRMTADYMPTHENQCDNPVVGSSESVDKSISQAESVSPIPQDLALPRVAFCLAHNGKVAWDVKWRPSTANAACKERMGYLAVLLGNGSLEVWEVPIPGMVKTLFTSSCHRDTDPRFLKLTPVFRCSKVKRGDKQSIPLTMEWSPSFPHDLILAGCHDGTVILWKFSTDCSSEDNRPLLCFIADSTPIRSVAWAPNASEVESSNLFVTAGHEGIKFWDIRDPYRALWEFNPIQRAVLSLDWVNDTRCIVMALDDGTMKTLSLSNAASDVPITGKPYAGSKYQGMHSYSLSSFAIWSIHVSRTSGFVAYCCADGSTIRFQLTARSVDKDPSRNRMPHFLCGSLLAEGGTLKIHTPLPNAPLPQFPFIQKKPPNECRNANRISASFSEDNQGEDQASTVEGQGILVIKKEEDEGSKEEFEVFPPKTVAMHRVRWNMNKGSERWLCYGGAAGVVRCQRINLS